MELAIWYLEMLDASLVVPLPNNRWPQAWSEARFGPIWVTLFTLNYWPLLGKGTNLKYTPLKTNIMTLEKKNNRKYILKWWGVGKYLFNGWKSCRVLFQSEQVIFCEARTFKNNRHNLKWGDCFEILESWPTEQRSKKSDMILWYR